MMNKSHLRAYVRLMKRRFNSKKNITGRSMVEMLGVLAIIGVLSIGGISGYTLAIRRYRANDILEIANQYALEAFSICQSRLMNDPGTYKRFGGSGDYKQDCLTNMPSAEAQGFTMPTGIVAINVYRLLATSNANESMLPIEITFEPSLDNKYGPLCETIASIAGIKESSSIDYYHISAYCKAKSKTERNTIFVPIYMN